MREYLKPIIEDEYIEIDDICEESLKDGEEWYEDND